MQTIQKSLAIKSILIVLITVALSACGLTDSDSDSESEETGPDLSADLSVEIDPNTNMDFDMTITTWDGSDLSTQEESASISTFASYSENIPEGDYEGVKVWLKTFNENALTLSLMGDEDVIEEVSEPDSSGEYNDYYIIEAGNVPEE